MPLVTVKDKFQVTIPAKLRDQIKIQIGDLLEVSVHEEGLLLRPKEIVDRKAIADQVDAISRLNQSAMRGCLHQTDCGASKSGRKREGINDISGTMEAVRYNSAFRRCDHKTRSELFGSDAAGKVGEEDQKGRWRCRRLSGDQALSNAAFDHARCD